MTTFTIERATLATLPDAFALSPDPAEAQVHLERFHQRVAEGKARPEQYLLLRSERGVEAAVFVADHPTVPLFPRAHADAPAAGLTQFLAYLREITPERTLLLDSGLIAPGAAPALAAGWVVDDEQVVYETDLTSRKWELAPAVVEGGAELLGRPEIRALAAELGQADLELDEGWRLVALQGESGEPAALGAVGPSNRRGWASINLMGVRESARGGGLGTRLHAHLLARAAERFTHHVGRTEADNHAMRRIFERNGCVPKSRQVYLAAEPRN